MYLTINQPTVTSEVIDGEAIIINLDNGSYYSMEGTAAELWRCIEAGCGRDTMLEGLTTKFAEHAAELGAELDDYLQGLLAERLVVASDVAEVDAEAIEFQFDFASADYSAPRWTKYNDMQDLLVLDPIHDVNEQGWPNAG